ncbi:GDSL-type esterase/lipase family protein [Asticcacaulis biprosthecium]|nr:GDSL-type esterase/lipase family protein [Asticcacaulis biprosthecium]
MVSVVRRGVLGGALLAGASFGMAGAAGAQALTANEPALKTDPAAFRDQAEAAAPPPPELVKVGQDWANLNRYKAANRDALKLPAFNRRAVLMGDSITDAWPGRANDIFPQNGLIGRGIGGQTTAQMVVRFQPDVVALKPVVVHILAGTNDVAENLDPYDFAATTNNLIAMAAMAKANNIRVVMGSVPPATSFAWRPALGNRSAEIQTLNAWIKKFCAANGHVYADYWPVLGDGQGGLKAALGADSVHPNAAGYAAMNPVVLAAIDKAMSRGK